MCNCKSVPVDDAVLEKREMEKALMISDNEVPPLSLETNERTTEEEMEPSEPEQAAELDVPECDAVPEPATVPVSETPILKHPSYIPIPKFVQRKMKNSPADYHSRDFSYSGDILFKFTNLTRQFLAVVQVLRTKVHSTQTLIILRRTTQPLHVLAILLVFMTCMMFLPVDQKSGNVFGEKFTHLTYFLTFSLHFGSQFWMTFVSGLSLYFNLGRHAFGDVQQILFPRYFALNGALSAVTLIQFCRLHTAAISDGDFTTILQIATLSLCCLIEISIRLLMVPTVLQLTTKKTMIEKKAGIGTEVGCYELGPLVKCPHYMGLHKAFRRTHMITAIGNITCIMCSCFHLYYLSYKCTINIQ